jgi:hypothetical protein
MKPKSDALAETGSALAPFVDRPNGRRRVLPFPLPAWGRPAIWAPVVDAVYAARDFLTSGAEAHPTSLAARNSPAEEPASMPVAKAPAKSPRPPATASPSLARLEAAVRKAAGAKAKARDAKAALKKAKKSFRVARKAAKAARKDLEALQAALTLAEERAAVVAKRARTTKPARKSRRVPSSGESSAELIDTEPLAVPTDAADEAPPATAS